MADTTRERIIPASFVIALPATGKCAAKLKPRDPELELTGLLLFSSR